MRACIRDLGEVCSRAPDAQQQLGLVKALRDALVAFHLPAPQVFTGPVQHKHTLQIERQGVLRAAGLFAALLHQVHLLDLRACICMRGEAAPNQA
jgi:hypothetical protein